VPRRRKLAVVILVSLATGVATPGEGPRTSTLGKPFPVESMDQAPAEKSAQDDPLARSPGMRVATGPYVSLQVNLDAQGRNVVGDAANEPSISVNPVNRSNMVIGWRQFNSVNSSYREAGLAYSFDKGATWTFPGVLTPGTFRSDPVLDVDSAGNFYYQSLRSNLSMDVFKSTNGGITWSAPVPAYGGDKNWMVVDRTGGPSDGYVYGTWARNAQSSYYDDILTLSINGAASFQPPMPVDFWPTWGTSAIGPDGTLFMSGIDGTQYFVDQYVIAWPIFVSGGDGLLAAAGRRVELGGSMGHSDGPNPSGMLGQANVATDVSTGSTRGNVYLLASVIPEGSTDPQDVHVVTSVDSGRNFSAPVRVNDDAGNNWQWLAAHAVAPNGRVDAIWFDTRDSGVSNISRLYYSYSWDAGATWSVNVPVSPQFNSFLGFPPQQEKMGDYSAIVSDVTGADVAYAATFTGGQDVYYVRLFPDCNGNGLSDVTDLAGHASLDCNLDHVPDECQTAPACIGAGRVGDGGAAPGVPLTAAKGAGDSIVLSWGVSCVSSDADYAVYEGSLGDFTSHAPAACSTAGALSFGLTPAAGDSYYLVVAVHADREGSYGTDGGGAERPQGASSCVPRSLHACGS